MEFTMSQYANKEDLYAAMSERIAELEHALSYMYEFFQPHAWGSSDNRADALEEARKALGL